MPMHYFSLKWYSEHETIDQMGLPVAPLQAGIRTSTDGQGHLAPKWRENTGSRSGGTRGAQRGLLPPAVGMMVSLLFLLLKTNGCAVQRRFLHGNGSQILVCIKIT